MLSNAYLLAKIGADTAENEQRFAEILPNFRLLVRRSRQSAEPAAGRRGRGEGPVGHQSGHVRRRVLAGLLECEHLYSYMYYIIEKMSLIESFT